MQLCISSREIASSQSNLDDHDLQNPTARLHIAHLLGLGSIVISLHSHEFLWDACVLACNWSATLDCGLTLFFNNSLILFRGLHSNATHTHTNLVIYELNTFLPPTCPAGSPRSLSLKKKMPETAADTTRRQSSLSGPSATHQTGVSDQQHKAASSDASCGPGKSAASLRSAATSEEESPRGNKLHTFPPSNDPDRETITVKPTGNEQTRFFI